MIGIRYKDNFLDVSPGAVLNWEMNNLLFSTSDSTKINGAFSFPFELPATAHNRALLGFPDRIDNANVFIQDVSIQVTYDSQAVFVGTLKVTDASSGKIEAYIVINPLLELKQTPLDEIDLGGDRIFGSAYELKADALASANAPLDYDYIYFPVYNLGFLDNETSPKQRWLNWFDADHGAVFYPSTSAPGFMPFIRLEYLLQQVFSGQEYAFINLWQITDELRSIVLFNNHTIFNSGSLDLTINLKNHVPKTQANELIKKIMAMFNLGLFYNPFTKVLRLVPLRSIINKAPAHDWTSKALSGMSIKSDNAGTPEIFQYKKLEDDNIQERYTTFARPVTIIDTVENLPLLDAASVEGMYYVISEASYWWHDLSGGIFRTLMWGNFFAAPEETAKRIFETDMQPLYDVHVTFVHGAATVDTWMLRAPVLEAPGTIKYTYTPPGGDPTDVEQSNENPLRLTIYRGFAYGTPYPGYSTRQVPYASSTPYGPGSGIYGEISLRWEGVYGLYETWWKQWHQMLLYGKNVTIRLHLSIADLVSFNFEQKIRIQNMDFLVKRLRISLTPRGLAPVEAELVSVI